MMLFEGKPIGIFGKAIEYIHHFFFFTFMET